MSCGASGSLVACLPMYDWPEITAATDRYWERLRESIADHGLMAPAGLERVRDRHEVWLDPGLVLGQTCGLPYVSELEGRVSLVGRPAYDIECGAGCYYSLLIVSEQSQTSDLKALSGGRYAFNDARSQSGHAAFHSAMIEAGIAAGSWSQAIETGSHRASIQAVANGRADVAAIDAVAFELALRHEPAARRVRVLARTPVMPGLPYITALRPAREVIAIHDAVCMAMASLDEDVRDALLLIGFDPATPADYAPIRTNWQKLGQAGLNRVT